MLSFTIQTGNKGIRYEVDFQKRRAIVVVKTEAGILAPTGLVLLNVARDAVAVLLSVGSWRLSHKWAGTCLRHHVDPPTFAVDDSTHIVNPDSLTS